MPSVHMNTMVKPQVNVELVIKQEFVKGQPHSEQVHQVSLRKVVKLETPLYYQSYYVLPCVYNHAVGEVCTHHVLSQYLNGPHSHISSIV